MQLYIGKEVIYRIGIEMDSWALFDFKLHAI